MPLRRDSAKIILMAQYLVTEYTQAAPQVLLLGDTDVVYDDLVDILEKHGFNAQIYTFTQLRKSTVRERVRQNSYYKVICLFNLSGPNTTLEELEMILASRREPILFITRFDSTVDVDNLQTRPWYQACRQQYQQILALAQKYPRANQIIVRDLLLNKTPYHPSFSYIFRQSDAGLLTDPGINFFFISQKNFFSQIEAELFAPYAGEKILFTANALSPVKVFHHFDEVTHHRFRVITESYPPVEFAFPFPVTDFAGQADLNTLTSDYLDTYLTSLVSPSRSANRQKLYASAKSARNILRPVKKNNSKDFEQITLPPPKISPKDTRDHRLDQITLPPELAGTGKNSRDKKSRSVKSARQILKAVRTTITSQEETVLERYLAAEKVKSTPKLCRRVRLDGINFIQCITPEDAGLILPTLTTKTTLKTPALILEVPPTPIPASEKKLLIKDKDKTSTSKTVTNKKNKKTPSSSSKNVSKKDALTFVTSYFSTPFKKKTIPLSSLPLSLKPSLSHQVIETIYNFFHISPKKVKKYTKKQIITYKKEKNTKNKNNKQDLLFSSILHSPSVKHISRHYGSNRFIAASAVGLALIIVVYYFFFVQPRQNEKTVISILTTYFQECVDQNSCFNSNALRRTYTNSLVKKNSLPDFTLSLTRLTTKYERLTNQLDTYFATAWQNQSGDVTIELQILRQNLDNTQKELQNVRRSFDSAQAELHALASSDQLGVFTTNLSQLEKRIQLIDDYLPLFEAFASRPELKTTLILMDQNVARTGGGLILGAANLDFLKGAYQQTHYLTTTSMIKNSSVEVHTPHQLKDVKTTETSGLHNLTFAREFSETASLLQTDLRSALAYKPDIIIGVNLNTISHLEQLLLDKPAEQTLSQQAKIYNTGEKEMLLEEIFSELNIKLDRFVPSRGHEFIELLLQNLESGQLQFYTTDDTLKNAINTVKLRSDVNSVRCPSGFGSSVCYLDTFAGHEDYLNSNSFLTQNITHRIEINGDVTKHSRTIIFTNESPSESVSDYLTFHLPQNAQDVELLLNDQEIKLDDDNAYQLQLNPGKTATLEVKFSITRQITNSDFTYSYYDQHQNGYPDQNLQVIITNHVPYSIHTIAPRAVTKGDVITFARTGAVSFFGAVDY